MTDVANQVQKEDLPQWTFGDRLRKARRHCHLSQADLAAALGISTPRLGNWESGANGPRGSELIDFARRAAAVTDVPVEWFLGLESPRSRCFSESMLVGEVVGWQITDAPMPTAVAA